MKIGVVCPYNIAMPGGVQQHVFEQTAELRRRGHTVKLITPNPRGKLLTDDPEVVFLGTSARFKTHHTSVDVSITVTTEAIDELLEKENFDIIHMHEPLVPILARQMLPRITCPVVGTFHAAMPESVLAKSIAGSFQPFVKSVVKHLSAVTAVSSAATSYVGNYVSVQDVHIVPNGVDLVKYHLPPLGSPRKNILYVGRLEKRKGVKYLIRAFTELHKTDPTHDLIIAGDGPDREKLQKLVEEYDLTTKVHFLGYIDDAKKQKLMHQCALFVSPALYGESFGIVLIEAMASGAVVLGGFNPGYATVLSGSGAIGLIDPQETELFANRMHLLLHDQPIRDMLVKWAHEEVKKYSYKSIVDDYEKIYNSLVA
jgi:phosphatidylinositol alpha-mannosyltransferase